MGRVWGSGCLDLSVQGLSLRTQGFEFNVISCVYLQRSGRCGVFGAGEMLYIMDNAYKCK